MATEIKIPKMGVAMTEGGLVEWTTDDGAEVAAGEVIYVLEADKTEIEIESPVAGVIRHLAETGEMYDVGHVIAQIE